MTISTGKDFPLQPLSLNIFFHDSSLVFLFAVGFGDYSPTTVLSRAFTILATIAGVTYFSMASVQILELKKIEDSGLGRFRPSKKAKYQGGRGHILVMGGGVACGSPMVLETFLRALCRGDNTPEIVLMSEAPCSDPVRQLLRQEWTRNFKIHYFVGAPLDRHDMERVRASQCSQIFVIADFQTADSPTEDRSNLMYAMHVQVNSFAFFVTDFLFVCYVILFEYFFIFLYQRGRLTYLLLFFHFPCSENLPEHGVPHHAQRHVFRVARHPNRPARGLSLLHRSPQGLHACHLPPLPRLLHARPKPWSS